MYGEMIDWLIEKLNGQQDTGPLEDLAAWLSVAGYPKYALISIGATRYTDLGETTYLQPGDESIVVAYDGTVFTPGEIAAGLAQDTLTPGAGLSLLRQTVAGE